VRKRWGLKYGFKGNNLEGLRGEMGMETAAYILGLLRNGGELFSAIYDFNNGMTDYAHGDFFQAALPKELIRHMARSTRYGWKVLERIRGWLGIDDLGCYDFSEARRWLCLLSAEEVQRVMNYMGGICFAEEIRKVILGRELLKLKRTIGDDAYFFALRSASLILRAEVAERFQAAGETLVERVYNTGKTIIEMSLAGVPRAITQRFALKFPKNFGWNFTHEVENPQYYFDFVKKVVKRAIQENGSVALSMIKA
jgi:hypothetical protein